MQEESPSHSLFLEAFREQRCFESMQISAARLAAVTECFVFLKVLAALECELCACVLACVSERVCVYVCVLCASVLWVALACGSHLWLLYVAAVCGY